MTANGVVANAALCVVTALASVPAIAIQRTFVASTGVDGSGCTRSTPCRTFAGALTATDPDGEIVALDSAGYGTLVIDRSVTIQAAPGVLAGVTVTAGAAITINAPAGKVVLRGLTINGQGVGFTAGISITSPTRVSIEKCTISNLASNGIELPFTTSTGSRVVVTDTLIHDAGGTAVRVQSASHVTIDNVQMLNNGSAVQAWVGATVSVRNSVAANSYIYGFFASDSGSATPTRMILDGVAISSTRVFSPNDAVGVESVGVGTQVRITRSTIAHNEVTGVRIFGTGVPVVTVVGSEISNNPHDAIRVEAAGGFAVASGNAIFNNGGAGLHRVPAAGTGLLESRQNNSIRRNGSGDTSGAITPAGGL